MSATNANPAPETGAAAAPVPAVDPVIESLCDRIKALQRTAYKASKAARAAFDMAWEAEKEVRMHIRVPSEYDELLALRAPSVKLAEAREQLAAVKRFQDIAEDACTQAFGASFDAREAAFNAKPLMEELSKISELMNYPCDSEPYLRIEYGLRLGGSAEISAHEASERFYSTSRFVDYSFTELADTANKVAKYAKDVAREADTEAEKARTALSDAMYAYKQGNRSVSVKTLHATATLAIEIATKAEKDASEAVAYAHDCNTLVGNKRVFKGAAAGAGGGK
jgi:hypothetical protein